MRDDGKVHTSTKILHDAKEPFEVILNSAKHDLPSKSYLFR